jgi:sugar O-acyltransferase (sialic acid O-acetyltransferase NeuD family)
MPVLADMLGAREGDAAVQMMFVVEGDGVTGPVNGYPVLTLDQYARLGGERYFNVAIADSRARERIALKCSSLGLKPVSIVSRTSVVLDHNEIGEGAILSPFTTITSNVRIGRFFHANIYSYVEHDCVIGDFVTFAPAVKCNGAIVIGDHAYVGTGAMLRQGSADRPLMIGTGAVVGMGAVVTRDVAPFTTVVGNPARPIARRNGGDG